MAAPQSMPFVVVHGPPGAGKSRLARNLSSSTGLPYIDRDEIKDTVFDVVGFSDRDWSTRVGRASWDLLGLWAERLIVARLPFIVESNFCPGPAVERLRSAFASSGMVVASVHVTASPEALWERFDARRLQGGRHPGHAGFTDRAEFLSELARRDFGPIDFGGPCLRLDTTSAWPDLDAVSNWLEGVPASRADNLAL